MKRRAIEKDGRLGAVAGAAASTIVTVGPRWRTGAVARDQAKGSSGSPGVSPARSPACCRAALRRGSR